MTTPTIIDMIPRHRSLKLLYFFQGAGAAPILPFLPLIAKQMGVTGSGFGFALASVGITVILTRPFIVRLVDTYPEKRLLIFRLMLLGAITGFGMISMLPTIQKTDLHSNLMVHGCDGSDKNAVMWLTHPKRIEDPCLINKLKDLRKLPMTCVFSCENKSGADINNFWGDIFMSTADARPIEINHNSIKDHKLYEHITFKTSIQCKVIENENLVEVGADLTRCGIECPSDKELNFILTSSNPGEAARTKLLTNITYWGLIVYWLVGAVFCSAIGPVQDTFCHQILRTESEKQKLSDDDNNSKPLLNRKPESFGQQRLYASIGYGSCALLTGYIIDHFSENSFVYNYSPCFVLMTSFWCLAAYTVGRLEIEYKQTHTIANNATRKTTLIEEYTMFEDVKETLFKMLSKRRSAKFLFYVAATGSCMGSMNIHFLLLDELGQQSDCEGSKAIKFLQGLCIAIQCTGELPIFRFSGRLIEYLGINLSSYAVLLAYMARFMWYGMYMTSPWQTIFVEPLHGICIGLFYPILTLQAISIANDLKENDKNRETTVMALVYCVSDLGSALGGLVCGYVYQEKGAAITFQCMSCFTILILLLLRANVK